ncbi:stage II sporulation protein D [Cohnella candidum]|uniref:Stage II sporulation protein D n=1 Tax=Cohnella candidum TaxID=2674991 RepID=A0A3G3K1D2_9BACL|nr:stage II sporulation protein D [Cohnella candidum]AYQ74190.1 stage II sporulation protein D [Cohnella candidum]
MKSLNRLEWTAFAGGMVIALALWLVLHHRDAGQQEAQSTLVQVSEIQWDNETDKRSTQSNSTNADSPNQPTTRNPSNTKPYNASANQPEPIIRVYLSEQRRIEKVPLETYVRGVVAGEMPADFEPAALEAQALAARTYMVRRLKLHDTSGVPVDGADVTDTQVNQVYRSLADMDNLRKQDGQAYTKIDDAVNNTKGKVIAYQGEPIQALYFSASNGYTENSEDVFPGVVPYLRSVISPWDRVGAPRSEETVQIPLDQFYEKLGIDSLPAGGATNGKPNIVVTEWSTGHRIKSITIAGQTFTGQELREKLGLRSTSFSWTTNNDEITFTTYGNGHGVGMSQWGAEGMAREGRTAEEIVEYYYSGTKLMEVSNLMGLSGKSS